MVNVDLTDIEIDRIIQMISGASCKIGDAEEAIELLNKFKEAKD